MHKQSHQNTHIRPLRIERVVSFISDEKSQVIFVVITSDLSLISRLGLLRASSKKKAATILSARSDEQWLMLRIKDNQSPASKLLAESRK